MQLAVNNGKFVTGKNKKLILAHGTTPVPPTPTMDGPICFTAQQANSTVALVIEGEMSTEPTLQYSMDGEQWNDYTNGTYITLAAVGNKVYFKGNNSSFTEEYDEIYAHFSMTGLISASGNTMSLLDETCESTMLLADECFSNLFRDCTALTTAPALPATMLSYGCYENMFDGCTALVTPPELPATSLSDSCYFYMFFNCTSLTVAPVLPALRMKKACYNCMFEGCSSLVAAPSLPATETAYNCYQYMFHGCTSLTTVPNLPATNLEGYCYGDMFEQCSSLKVYSSSGEGHTYAWRIPTSGTATGDTTFDSLFLDTEGDFSWQTYVDVNQTFYTQNAPV